MRVGAAVFTVAAACMVVDTLDGAVFTVVDIVAAGILVTAVITTGTDMAIMDTVDIMALGITATTAHDAMGWDATLDWA